MEEAFEQIIFLPHLPRLQTQLQVYLVPQADAHDLIQVISC